MDFLIQADKSLFLFLNGINNPFFDKVMWIVTTAWIWIPLYVSLVVWFIIKYKRYAVLIIIFAALSVILSDLVSVNLFKEVFCRLRPSHNPEFEGIIHLVDGYKGGFFGFVSSHAANSFAVAVFTLLVFRNRWYTLAILFWACLVSYSRIYVGVHYPADLAGGAVTGSVIATIMYIIMIRIKKKPVISDHSS